MYANKFGEFIALLSTQNTKEKIIVKLQYSTTNVYQTREHQRPTRCFGVDFGLRTFSSAGHLHATALVA
jgi:hypothetical protein